MTEDSMTEDIPGIAPINASRSFRLAKHAGIHSLVWLVSLSLFAAADSWSAVSGLGIASVLSVITGILAGLTSATLIHEWFHLLGARFSAGAYDIPAKPGLFVLDWDFSANNVRQFFIMSVGGSVGGALAVVLLWAWVPSDTLGRAALLAGGIAAFVFAAVIEWPVLRRTRTSADPLAELSKIDQRVLWRSFTCASIAGVVMTTVLAQ